MAENINNYENFEWNGTQPLSPANLNKIQANIYGAYQRFDILIGFVSYFCSPTPPDGWLICDGRELDVGTYEKLYNVIGTTFGGDANNQIFNLPDLRGEFIRGYSAGREDLDNGRQFGTVQKGTTFKKDKLIVGYDDGGEEMTDKTTSAFGGHTGGSGDYTFFSVRPRNIALLPCIYTGVHNIQTIE